MPFTPFHFGPSASVAFPLKKYIDIPVFVLANVVIDLEPLTVMVFNLSYPVHGFFHTLLGGIFIGTLWGLVAYSMKNFINGFCVCFFLMTILFMVKSVYCDLKDQSADYSNQFSIKTAFDGIYNDMQPISHTIVTSTPTLRNLRNGEIVVAQVGGVTSVFLRVNNSTFSLATR